MMQFWSLTKDSKGYSPLSYEQVRALQLLLVELRYQGLIPDTILFLEHEPVITQGRGLQWTGKPQPRHMPLPGLMPPGIAFSESERGGDLTYHGPGQLVIYPICKLDGQGFGPLHDVTGFLRKLESLWIQDLKERGLEALSKESATGIWIGSRKVASIGIAVRKWVTYHGIAINCVNDLKPFHLISPCGFNPDVMTRLKDWIPLDENWRTQLEASIARRFVSAMTDLNQNSSLNEKMNDGISSKTSQAVYGEVRRVPVESLRVLLEEQGVPVSFLDRLETLPS